MKIKVVKYPKEYQEMTLQRKMILRDWIMSNFYPRKSMNKYHTSYGLKHMVQADINEYYTNDEFKGGMLDAGFIPDDDCDLNWCFNLSEKSYKETRKRLDKERK